MNAIETARAELTPSLDQLLQALMYSGEVRGHQFFMRVSEALARADAEEDLLEICLALSTSAFQGFLYSPDAALLLDDLLARAEVLAMTYSVDDSSPH